MLIIKSRLFYIIGVSIYLFLKLRWGDLFKLLLTKPKTKNINHNSSQNVYKEVDKTLVSIVQGDDIDALLKEGINWVEVDIPHGRFVKKAIVSEFIYNVLNNAN